MARVLVVGGGVVGRFCAWYAREAGHEAVVLESGPGDEGCSFKNSGLVVPSHAVPLASPGVVARGLKWLASRESPFCIRPCLDPAVFAWTRLFVQHCTHAHVERSAPVLARAMLASHALYAGLASGGWDFGYRQSGLLQVCRTEAGLEEEAKLAQTMAGAGVASEVLGPASLARLEPSLEQAGAVYYPGDSQLDPEALMRALGERLAEAGVEVRRGLGTVRVAGGRRGVRAEHSQGTEEADWGVVACGAATPAAVAALGLALPMVGGRGYSFVVPAGVAPVSRPCILVEDRVAISPLGARVRIGGTMEIGKAAVPPDMRRVAGICKAVGRYFPTSVDVPSRDEVWSGSRPCSPDGLPYVGPVPEAPRWVVASGHAMLGVTLAPGTGRMVAAAVSGQAPDPAFAPARFSG